MKTTIVCNASPEGTHLSLLPNLLDRVVNRAKRFIKADEVVFEGVKSLPALSVQSNLSLACTQKASIERIPLAESLAYRIIQCDDDGTPRAETQESLALPTGFPFYDFHIHTPMAYCNENMDFMRLKQLAELMGLTAIGFSEHSGHLHFPVHNYWETNEWYARGMDSHDRLDRAVDYFSMVAPHLGSNSFLGMEIDVDQHGNLLVTPEESQRLQYRIGAVHYLNELHDGSSLKQAETKLLALSEAMLRQGIHILAHPVRELVWYGCDVSDHLARDMARLLSDYDCVCEVNFHVQDTPDNLVEACLERGVRLCFAGDVHNLCELGEFSPAITQLKRLAPGMPLQKIICPYQRLIHTPAVQTKHAMHMQDPYPLPERKEKRQCRMRYQ